MKSAWAISMFLLFLSVTCTGYQQSHRWHRAHQNYLRYRQPLSPILAHPTIPEIDSDVITGRVVRGRNANWGEIPCQLHLRVVNNQGKIKTCGAALVELNSIQFVLTAAHCVYDGYPTPRSAVPPGNCRMVAGDRSKAIVSGLEQLKTAHRIVMHEKYSGADEDKYSNDLAIIFYKTPFTLTKYIQPIDLPGFNWEQPNPSATVQVSGWGANSVPATKIKPDILQVANISVLPTANCRSFGFNEQTGTGDSRIRISNKILCLLDPIEGKSACIGDSGGPAIAVNKNTGRKYLAGIFSFVYRGCGSKRFPIMYTFIPPYIDWIRTKVNDWINTGKS